RQFPHLERRRQPLGIRPHAGRLAGEIPHQPRAERGCGSAGVVAQGDRMTADFLTKYGPWALVIGGSEGIGASFARKLAERGLNLVLVARKKRELEETAALIRKLGVQVLTLSTDVSKPREALAAVRRLTDPVEIGFMLYMAGANLTRGVFPDVDLELARKVVAMNVDGQMEF